MNDLTASQNNKTNYQASLFANRIARQYKLLKKWARKNHITSYRLYDRDIPEIPLALDLYTFLPEDINTKMDAVLFLNEESASISRNDASSRETVKNELSRTYLHMYLYERPYEKPEEEEREWLNQMKKAASQTLGIDESHIIIKTRKKQSDSEGTVTSMKKSRVTEPLREQSANRISFLL